MATKPARSLARSSDMSDKQRLREQIWSAIDAASEVRRAPGAVGRIPNFVGAEQAAERFAGLPEWRRAQVLKMNPDSPQLALRTRAIVDGKLVFMAVPKLARDEPFTALELSKLTVRAIDAASVEGAARHGVPTALGDMPAIDLIVCGSVAVNADGVRIGKGGGYADIEYALLAELGLVTEQTTIATTVHDLQVLEQALPETAHDFRLDLIVTPTRVLRCPRGQRPRGIIWEDLDPEKIASIPALAARAAALTRR
jgi:5-formyltetrahydrofolate cyclo-ligase